jgi:hypothetical protein
MSISLAQKYHCYFCHTSVSYKVNHYECNVEGLVDNVRICHDCDGEIDRNFTFLPDRTKSIKNNFLEEYDSAQNIDNWRAASEYYVVLCFTINLETYTKMETDMKDTLDKLQRK